MARKTRKIYAVANRKGGVGKTTTAVNLAHGLAMGVKDSGGIVLLVDVDPQGDAASSLGFDDVGGRCISNVITGRGTLKENILPAKRDGLSTRDNLYILPSSDALKDAMEFVIEKFQMYHAASNKQMFTEMYGAAVAPDDVLVHYLGPTLSVFDYIVIDCPPSLGTMDTAVYKFADAAVVPIKLDYLGAKGTGRHTENLLDVKHDGANINIAAFVLTFVQAKIKLTKTMYDDLFSVYDRNKIKAVIPYRPAGVAEAPAHGMTLFEFAADAVPAQQYHKLVRALTV